MVAISELIELDVEELALVGKGANGFPALFQKAVAEEMAKAGQSSSEGAEADDAEAAKAANAVLDALLARMAEKSAKAKMKVKAKTKGPVPSGIPVMEGEDEEGDAVKSDSAEADEILEEVTDEAAKAAIDGLCGVDDCEVCIKAWQEAVAVLPVAELVKAKLKAKQRRALPKSEFAIPEKAPESGSYPIPDEAHARNALARVAQFGTPKEKQRVRRAVRRKFPQIKVSDGAEKSPGVPDVATATPREGGHNAKTGKSGVAGRATAGEVRRAMSVAYTLGGESSYKIPAEAKIDQSLVPNRDGSKRLSVPVGTIPAAAARQLGGGPGAGIGVSFRNLPDGELITIGEAEKGDWLSVDNTGGNGAPGSPRWEDYDAATLDEIARGLAACERAVCAIQQRERVEAAMGDSKDWLDACDLGTAADAINCALGFVARLAYHEAVEGGVKKAVSAASQSHIRDAWEHLTALIGGGANAKAGRTGTEKESNDMATVTKEELAQLVTDAATSAVKGPTEEAKKIAKKAAKAAKQAARDAKKARRDAKKAASFAPQRPMGGQQSNNGGEVTAQDELGQVGGQYSADDVNAVPDGGKVRPEFVNKESKKDRKVAKALAAMADQLAKSTALVEKMASRPRPGGPVLDGVPRAGGTGAFPAAEQRLTPGGTEPSEIDRQIAKLEKQLEETDDPVAKSNLSNQLTYQRLVKAHEAGLI